MSDEVAIPDPNRVTKYIWRNIGKKSAREMAQELGVRPEEILRAKRELVEGVDELTIQLQKAKLMESLQEIADDAKEAAMNASDERNKAGLYNAAAGSIDKLLKEFNRTSKNESEALNALNRARIQELVELVQETVDESVIELSTRYEIPEQDIYDVFNTHLGRAAERRDAEFKR